MISRLIHRIHTYPRFCFSAHPATGHGIHSPFVYSLAEQIFSICPQYYAFKKIEQQRNLWMTKSEIITMNDFGAGGLKKPIKKTKVSKLAARSLLPSDHAGILFALANRFNSHHVLELGTSLGITTAYLASVHTQSQVWTIEGSKEVLGVARQTWGHIGIKNIHAFEGTFDLQLPIVLDQMPKVDFAFIDGNHQYQPTLDYFNKILEKTHEQSVLVFDDIYWSKEMTQAWNEIKRHPKVSVTIDLYRMGLVFLRKESTKQDFKLRF